MRPGHADAARSLRVALFQPVLPHYRVDLFNAFDAALDGGLTLFTVSATDASRLGGADDRLVAARRRARTLRIGPLWVVPTAVVQVAVGRWDAVVLSWNARQVEILLALLIGRVRRVPVILWGHGLGRRRRGAGAALRRIQARLSAGVITYGHAGAADVRAMVPGHPVVVLLNTTGRPPPTGADVLDAPRRRVAHLGRLLEHKRPDRLIDAVARLEEHGIELEVDVIGDGPARAAMEAAVRRAGLGSRVHWHGQVTDWEAVRRLLAGVDLVVLPARAGLAVVDGLAAARPVLVLDGRGENPPEADVIVDGQSGFRYRPGTVAALTDRLRAIYQDPDVLLAASAGAAELYRDELRLEDAAAVFADIVTTAAGRDR